MSDVVLRRSFSQAGPESTFEILWHRSGECRVLGPDGREWGVMVHGEWRSNRAIPERVRRAAEHMTAEAELIIVGDGAW